MAKESVTYRDEAAVVVPVYNRASLLARTLDSIEAQSYRPVHLIVVDNNSSDGSGDAARSWAAGHEKPGFRVTVVEEHSPGAAAARNRGLREVTARRVSFFDSDDMMRPDLLEEAMAAFERNPEAKIVYWRALRHRPDGSESGFHFTRKAVFECHLIHALLTTTFYMSDTAYFRNAGGWNDTVMGWNDWEVGIRLLLGSPVCEPVDRILTDVYVQDVSITGTSMSAKAGVWEHSLEESEKAARGSRHPGREWILRLLSYRTAILAACYRKEGHPELADPLLKKALAFPELNALQRCLLKLAYAYTSRGGRGAYRLLAPFMGKTH